MEGRQFEMLYEEVKSIRVNTDRLREEFSDHKEKNAEEISALKVKASIWGAISGALTGVGLWLGFHK